MRILAQFSRRFLYRHPGQLLLALVGIAAGVAVVTGVALLRDVLLQSLDTAAEALSGRDSLRIEHRSGVIDEELEQLYAALVTSPGAPALVPVLQTRVRHDGEILELLAIDPLSLAEGGPMRLTGAATGSLLSTSGAVMTNRHTQQRLLLAVGEPWQVRVAGRRVELTLIATIEGSRELDNRLVMDLANAQHLLGRRGELSWIEAPAGARDWLIENLPDELVLIDAGQRRDSAARLTAGMRTNLTALSLLGLVVGLFVVYSVLAFLLVQRRQQIGMLRAVGVTPRQLGMLLAGETIVLAGLGALAGLALGTWLATRLLDLVRSPVAELYGLITGTAVAPTPGLYTVIWLATLVMAVLSITGLLTAALRIQPGQLSRQTGAGPGLGLRARAGLAAVLVLAGLGAMIALPGLAWVLIGLFLLLCACALLAPPVGMLLLKAGHLARPRGLTGRALGMLGNAHSRLAPALAALSLALGLSAGIVMMVLGFRVAVDDWVDRLLRADTYLTLTRGQIDQDLVAAVANWPELRALSSVRQHELADGRQLMAYDLPEAAWAGFEWLAGGQADAHQRFVDGDGVLISEPMARRSALAVGDQLTIPTPEGVREFSILGVYRDYASDRGVIAIDGASYRTLFSDKLRDSLGLYFHPPGVDHGTLAARLEAMGYEALLTDRERVRRQTMAVFDQTFRITWALAALVGLIAAIALVSALLALGLERGREYATLRALGLTRARLAAWVVTQTTGLAAAAAILAIPISLMIHVILSLVVQPQAFGWSVSFTLPWQVWLVLVPLALLVGLLAGLYPAWKIASRDPAPLLKAR